MIQKYIKDIQRYVEAIPYGECSITVKRVGKKTTNISFEGQETLRYQDPISAIEDIHEILKKLSEDGFSGSTHVQCEYKDGAIKMVAIHDKIQIQY